MLLIYNNFICFILIHIKLLNVKMNDLLFGAENVRLKVLKNTLLFGVLFGRKRRRRICPFKSCKTTLLLGVLFGRKRRGGFEAD